MSRKVGVQYDKFIESGENSWLVKIDEQYCYFPYSLCDIDEDAKVVLCPLWLVVKKELEDYAA